MAAHNTGVSQRTLAPDTIARFRIGTAEQNRDAPTQKQASPAFSFTGAGSSSPVHYADCYCHIGTNTTEAIGSRFLGRCPQVFQSHSAEPHRLALSDAVSAALPLLCSLLAMPRVPLCTSVP